MTDTRGRRIGEHDSEAFFAFIRAHVGKPNDLIALMRSTGLRIEQTDGPLISNWKRKKKPRGRRIPGQERLALRLALNAHPDPAAAFAETPETWFTTRAISDDPLNADYWVAQFPPDPARVKAWQEIFPQDRSLGPSSIAATNNRRQRPLKIGGILLTVTALIGSSVYSLTKPHGLMERPEMVLVPAGSFIMGADSGTPGILNHEQPARRVTLSAFYMSRYEVTERLWSDCAATGPCRKTRFQVDGNQDQPVANVSWDEARAFAQWLSDQTGEPFRLPTEAEWEFALGVDSDATYPWGTDAPSCRSEAISGVNFADCNLQRTNPVGTFAPNSHGLYDMLGNVSEWVADCYEPTGYDLAPTDGEPYIKRDCDKRVLRGGSYLSPVQNLRATSRFGAPTDYSAPTAGFRLALSRVD